MDSLTANLGLEKIKEIPALNVKVYELGPNISIEEAVQRCMKNPHVEYAEPDYQVHALDEKKNPK